MRITIIRPCVVGGRPRCVGDEFEVSAQDGDLLVGQGNALPADAAQDDDAPDDDAPAEAPDEVPEEEASEDATPDDDAPAEEEKAGFFSRKKAKKKG